MGWRAAKERSLKGNVVLFGERHSNDLSATRPKMLTSILGALNLTYIPSIRLRLRYKAEVEPWVGSASQDDGCGR